MTSQDLYREVIAKMSQHPREERLISLRHIKHGHYLSSSYILKLKVVMHLFRQEDVMMSIKLRYSTYQLDSTDLSNSQNFTSISSVHVNYKLVFCCFMPVVFPYDSKSVEVFLVIWFKNGRRKEYSMVDPEVVELVIASERK